MIRVEPLPGTFERHEEIGGVLRTGVFDDCAGTDDEAIEAIAQTLPPDSPPDRSRLAALGYRRIDERVFLGDWYDPGSGALIKHGAWTTSTSIRREDLKLVEVDKAGTLWGSFNETTPGEGGQFSYAFLCPPYELRAEASEVQSLFDRMRHFILPPQRPVYICDWSSPELPAVSRYFEDGMEWWGVFLFTLYDPMCRRLIAIAASATD